MRTFLPQPLPLHCTAASAWQRMAPTKRTMRRSLLYARRMQPHDRATCAAWRHVRRHCAVSVPDRLHTRARLSHLPGTRAANRTWPHAAPL